MGCIGLFLGLVSFFFIWIDFFALPLIWKFFPSFERSLVGLITAMLVGLITAILGFVFSLVGLLRTQNGNKWLAVVGLVLSFIATACWLVIMLAFLVFFSASPS